MPKVIAYTYEADIHCPTCTIEATKRMQVNNQHAYAVPLKNPLDSNLDEHGLHYNLQDKDGNILGVIFNTDELVPTHCSDCGVRIN